MNKIEILNQISQSVDKLYDLVVEDEYLSSDFEKFLTVNEIEIESQAQFNNVVTNYLFEGKTQEGKSVLDYAGEKIPGSSVLYSLKNSFRGIFEIKRVAKTGYEVYSLINEQEMNLISLIKTTNLRSVGRYDFIEARVVEIDNEFYLLEIFDCIGSNYRFDAYRRAIKMIIQKPYLLGYKNEEKINEIKNYIKETHKRFLDYFGNNQVITTNKKADSLIHAFEKGESEYKNLIENIECDKYFDLEEFEEDDFLLSASGGFGTHKENYDTGLYSDENFGFFIIPFLGTFENIFKGADVENSDKCVLEFLFDDKIPPSVITRQPNSLQIINEVLKRAKIRNFDDINELVSYFKPVYYDNFSFSPVCALYNSKVFSQYMGLEETVV